MSCDRVQELETMLKWLINAIGFLEMRLITLESISGIIFINYINRIQYNIQHSLFYFVLIIYYSSTNQPRPSKYMCSTAYAYGIEDECQFILVSELITDMCNTSKREVRINCVNLP